MQHFCNSSPFFFNGIYPFQMPLKKRWTQCRVGSYPPTPPLSYTVALASATPKKSSQNVPIIPTNTAPRLRSFFNFTKKTLISRKKTNFTLSLQNVKKLCRVLSRLKIRKEVIRRIFPYVHFTT